MGSFTGSPHGTLRGRSVGVHFHPYLDPVPRFQIEDAHVVQIFAAVKRPAVPSVHPEAGADATSGMPAPRQKNGRSLANRWRLVFPLPGDDTVDPNVVQPLARREEASNYQYPGNVKQTYIVLAKTAKRGQ